MLRVHKTVEPLRLDGSHLYPFDFRHPPNNYWLPTMGPDIVLDAGNIIGIIQTTYLLQLAERDYKEVPLDRDEYCEENRTG